MPDLETIGRRLDEQDRRLAALEHNVAAQDTAAAVRKERDKHMDMRFDRIEGAVAEVKGYMLKIVWVIILGIVGSLLTFIINGGLASAPLP